MNTFLKTKGAQASTGKMYISGWLLAEHLKYVYAMLSSCFLIPLLNFFIVKQRKKNLFSFYVLVWWKWWHGIVHTQAICLVDQIIQFVSTTFIVWFGHFWTVIQLSQFFSVLLLEGRPQLYLNRNIALIPEELQCNAIFIHCPWTCRAKQCQGSAHTNKISMWWTHLKLKWEILFCSPKEAP